MNELSDGAAFLFKVRPLALSEAAAALLDPASKVLLAQISARLGSQNDWTIEPLEASLKAMAEELGLGLGKLAQPLRAALTGQTTSPGIFDVLVLLGKDESLARIDAQAVPGDQAVEP
jgi:glutamyl-tRNA synthetase